MLRFSREKMTFFLNHFLNPLSRRESHRVDPSLDKQGHVEEKLTTLTLYLVLQSKQIKRPSVFIDPINS